MVRQKLFACSLSLLAFTQYYNFALAAPLPGEISSDVSNEQVQTSDSEILQKMQISPAPKPVKPASEIKKQEHLFYKNSMSPRLGLILGSAAENTVDYLIGMNFFFDTLTDGKYETGIDLISKQVGVINLSKKWTYLDNEKFRPHTKLGIELMLDPSDGLATVLRKEHYMLATGIGFEDLLQSPLSLRWDFELAIGLEEYAVRIVFGYSWGF